MEQEFQRSLQKIGSRFFIGFEGKYPEDPGVLQIIDYIKNKLIGGVILFAHNIESSTQLIQLTQLLKSIEPSLIISIDQEGGKVQRLSSKNGFKDFKSAFEVTQMSLESAYQHYCEMGEILYIHGINLNFGPCVDIHDDQCPVIGKHMRSYSESGAKITQYAKAFIEAHQQYNISTCLKHFPGHGFSRQDSHKGLVDITDFAKPKLELEPYRALADRVEYVMIAHVINRQIDPLLPATLSDKYITPILKKQLHFKGKVVTDDIVMGAILDNFTINDACLKALEAGCDYIILSFHPLAMGNNKLPSDFSYIALLQYLALETEL